MTRVVVLSPAESEFLGAVRHYNRQGPGSGYESAAEVKAAFARIAAFPDAWPPFSARSRRCIVNRFPYGVLYQVRDDSILVLAIMHLKRNPARWQARAAEASPRRPRKGGR